MNAAWPLACCSAAAGSALLPLTRAFCCIPLPPQGLPAEFEAHKEAEQ